MSQQPPATLPPEIVLQICNELDTVDPLNRRALARLARSCRALYDLATPILYRNLVLDDLGVLDLLACGHRLSFRDPEYGTFTAEDWDFLEKERVARDWGHLPEPKGKTVLLLWDICEPHHPLFPNVTTLCVRDSPHAHDISWPAHRYGPNDVYPGEDVRLFHHPDYCGEGHSVEALTHLLPSRRGFRHVALHSGVTTSGLSGWATCSVYEQDPAVMLKSVRSMCRFRERVIDKQQAAEHGFALFATGIEDDITKLVRKGKFRLCLAINGDELEDGKGRVDMVKEWRTSADVVEKHYGGRLEVVFGEADRPGPDCPPCVVCAGSERGAPYEIREVSMAAGDAHPMPGYYTYTHS